MPRAIVLGGYGLIGSAILRALAREGFAVTGVGRSRQAAQAIMPEADWHIADLTRMRPAQWRDLLENADVVINAAGALQDGGTDRLAAIHEDVPRQLVAALQGQTARLIQISAAGASLQASTEFFRSKARGDALIAASGLDHVILRPTLVIGPQAYGGTALLRAAAGFPLVQWQLFQDSRIQTVALADVAAAAVRCAQGEIASGTVADLTETGSHSFPALITRLRRWQGFTPPRYRLPLPQWGLRGISHAADALGWLGWRSPLRSTAIAVLQEGISGDPEPWQRAGAPPCRSLEETLSDLPSTVQERWFARSYLLLPLLLTTLALFWLLSGVIGWLQFDAARALLTDAGYGTGLAAVAVAGGIVLDLCLGLVVLIRRSSFRACQGMVLVSLSYLIAGSLLRPELWADPLGPYVKVLPAMVLALVPLALGQNR